MKKFKVHYERVIEYDFTVEAESEEEAKEIIDDEFYDRLYDDEDEEITTDSGEQFCYAEEIKEER